MSLPPSSILVQIDYSPPLQARINIGVRGIESNVGKHLGLALPLQLGLFFFSDLLVDLGTPGGLVAVRAGRQSGVLFAANVLDTLVFFLILTLLLALELVGN